MKRHKMVRVRWLTGAATLALAAMACNLPFNATRQVPATPLPATPTPGEQLYTEPPELFPSATPADTEPPATPAASNTPSPVGRFDFQGLSFANLTSVFANAVGTMTPADPGEAEVSGWPGPAPAFLNVELSEYALGGVWIHPQVLVYPIHAYATVNAPAGLIAGQLDSELHAVEMVADSQPFLPMWNAAQVFHARPEVEAFQNGKGVRYLSCYAQSFVRIDAQCLFYTFQGLTEDGNYYVSAILPVDLPALHSAEADDRWAIIEADPSHYEQYVNEMSQLLAAARPEDFTPRLDQLDVLVSSLRVAPTVTLEAPAQAAFSCPGALATRLVPASRARVTFTDGTPLRVREAAGKGAKVLKTIPEGTEMFLLEGPVCADDGVWWHMQTNNASLSGWVMEGEAGVYFLESWP
jgi:hypothetical protein